MTVAQAPRKRSNLREMGDVAFDAAMEIRRRRHTPDELRKALVFEDISLFMLAIREIDQESKDKIVAQLKVISARRKEEQQVAEARTGQRGQDGG